MNTIGRLEIKRAPERWTLIAGGALLGAQDMADRGLRSRRAGYRSETVPTDHGLRS